MFKIIWMVVFSLSVISSSAFAGCSGAESEAHDGYRDAKKAYRSSDLDSCQWYAKKAYRHASDVESYASSCD